MASQIPLLIFLFTWNICGTFVNGEAGSAQQNEHDIKDVLYRLETRMSKIQTLKTDFIQEKELAIFKKKITLKGTVYLEKPASLAWHLREPVRFSMVMKNDTVYRWDEDSDHQQRVSLQDNPVLQIAIKQMEKWFAGSYTSMLSEYDIEILNRNPLTLKFVPLKSAIADQFIERVIVIFREDECYMHHIIIKEKNGDSITYKFVDTRINQPINTAVWEVKPRVP